MGITYWIIRLVSLSNRSRRIINILDHSRKTATHLPQLRLQILSKLISTLALLIRALKLIASSLTLRNPVNLLLISIQPALQLSLIPLHNTQLLLHRRARLLRLMRANIQLLDLISVVDQEPIPGSNLGGLVLELLLVLGEIGGPARDNLVHGAVLEAGHLGWWADG